MNMHETETSKGALTSFYTVNQIAHSLQYHPDTVRGYIRTGELKAKKMGRDYRVHPSDYESFVASR